MKNVVEKLDKEIPVITALEIPTDIKVELVMEMQKNHCTSNEEHYK